MTVLNLYGAGRLGQTLARRWHDNHTLSLGQVFTRSLASAQQACDFIGAGQACAPDCPLQAADIWLLACPDQALTGACQVLAASPAVRPGDLVLHCAGSQSSQLLAPLRARGCLIASVHPAHAFNPAQSLSSFAGSLCAAEGDAAALEQLKPLFEAIGGHWLELQTEHKARYHAATVMASNYLVTLLDQAQQLARSAGLSDPQARALLAPLARGALDNVLNNPAEAVLTGPVSRGDTATVLAHLQALAADKVIADLYHAQALATLALAGRQAADPDRLQSLKTALNPP